MGLTLYQSADGLPDQVLECMRTEFNKIPDSKSYKENYAYDYKSKPQNIFNMLDSGKFTIGNYMVLLDENKFLCSAGWYHFNPTTALAMVRMYVNPEYRHNYYTGKIILPKIFEQTEVYEKLWITVNEYNVSANTYMTNPKKFGNVWPEGYTRFKPIGQQVVNNVLQYVMEYRND